MREKILFVGIGQCGNNIAYEMEQLGYNAMCINTSNVDLESVKCKAKYHIPTGFGCNRDRDKALDFAMNYWQTMSNVIDRYFPRQDLIYFCYSLGGGTGSGISPVLADVVAQNNPNKTYGAVVVMPRLDDDRIILENAEICYRETTNVEGIKPLFILDNNTRDNKLEINKEFAYLYDSVVNMSNPDVNGVIDESEIEAVLRTKGNVIIEEWNELYMGNKVFNKSIFTPHYSTSQKVAVVSQKEINLRDLNFKIGNPYRSYKGHNTDKNLIIASGMTYPDMRIRDYQEAIRMGKVDRLDNEVKGLSYDIRNQKLKKDNVVELKPKVNVSEIFAKYKQV